MNSHRKMLDTNFLSATIKGHDITSSEKDSAQRIAIEDRREDLENKKQNRSQRKSYGNKLFVFLCVYMILVFMILFFCGFSLFGFTLSDTVLITLISTTTANVIGIFAFVVRYLFPAKNS